MASLARKFSPVSPLPMPRTSGEPCRAPTTRCGSAEDGDCVGAAQARQRALHGVEQIAVVQAVHQVGNDLGISLAGEDVAPLLQFRSQFVVVLDDPVVDQADAGRWPAAVVVQAAEGRRHRIDARAG